MLCNRSANLPKWRECSSPWPWPFFWKLWACFSNLAIWIKYASAYWRLQQDLRRLPKLFCKCLTADASVFDYVVQKVPPSSINNPSEVQTKISAQREAWWHRARHFYAAAHRGLARHNNSAFTLRLDRKVKYWLNSCLNLNGILATSQRLKRKCDSCLWAAHHLRLKLGNARFCRDQHALVLPGVDSSLLAISRSAINGYFVPSAALRLLHHQL